MGRPCLPVRRRATGTSRRDFFRRLGGAAAVLGAAPLLQACGGGGGGDTPPQVLGPFAHGVASGDPLADGVILWTRVTLASSTSTSPVDVEYVVATDPALGASSIVAGGRFTTDATRDYTVKVDVGGLKPATTYYYRFAVASASSGAVAAGVSPVGRTRTLPVGSVDRVRVAVASCASLAHGYFNAYRRIAERADLDLVVHLGDYIYEYGDGDYGSLRPYEPSHEIVSLADYRQRHAQYKRDTDVQALHRQHAMVAIWDDHEFADNAWSGGAANHTEGAEGTWTARVAAALQAYYEWMPVRRVDAAEPRRNNRSFALGNLVELVMLEERLLARSKQLDGNTALPGSPSFTQTGAYADASRQLLGSAEESWLATTLRGSKAQWKLLGQGVMFAQLKTNGASNAAGGGTFINSDQWDGYQPARDRVFDILKGSAGTAPLNDVVVLTGDIHSSWAADLTPDPNNPDAAAGGYDEATGAGSRAVEFVGTSVTAPALPKFTSPLATFNVKLSNPHIKYVDLTQRGYMLLDVDAKRTVCEWWYVDGIATSGGGETFGAAYQVQAGSNRLVPGAQTAPRVNPPAPAP